MMYIQPRRLYQDLGGFTSPILRDVAVHWGKVTLTPNFNVCNHRGTWKSSPFKEISAVCVVKLQTCL